MPVFSVDGLPVATGKSWEEWEYILNTGIDHTCGVLPVAQFLLNRYDLDMSWAQLIALEYVLGNHPPQRLN